MSAVCHIGLTAPSPSVQRGSKPDYKLHRVAASAIEQLVANTLDRLLPGMESDRMLQSVHLRPDAIDLVLPAKVSRAAAALIEGEEKMAMRDQQCVVTIPISLPLRGGRRSIALGQPDAANHDTILINALRKAHALVDRDARGQPQAFLQKQRRQRSKDQAEGAMAGLQTIARDKRQMVAKSHARHHHPRRSKADRPAGQGNRRITEVCRRRRGTRHQGGEVDPERG